MSRNLQNAALFFIAVIASAQTCSAQYNIDMTGLLQQQQESMNALNAQMNQLDQYQERLRKSIIDGYRQETRDYSTSDTQVFNQLQNQYYVQNPAAYQQKMAEDRYYAQEIGRINGQMSRDNIEQARLRSQIISNTNHEINAMSMEGFNGRMASMDRMQIQNVNGIYEQSRYINPATGQVVDLSFHPNQIQSTGGLHYYTDASGQQYQINPNYGYQQLNDFDE